MDKQIVSDKLQGVIRNPIQQEEVVGTALRGSVCSLALYLVHRKPISLNLRYTWVFSMIPCRWQSRFTKVVPPLLVTTYCSNSECEKEISTLRWRNQPYHAPLFDQSLLFLHVEDEDKTNFKLKRKYWKLIDPTWPVNSEFIAYHHHENPLFPKDVWGGPYFLFCKSCTALLRQNQTIKE